MKTISRLFSLACMTLLLLCAISLSACSADAPTAVSLEEEITISARSETSSTDNTASKHHRNLLILDQQQPVFDASGNPLAIGGGSDQILAQVIVPGEKNFLRRIDLPVACSDGSSLELEIWNNPDLPAQLSTDAAPAFSTSFPSSMIPAPLNGFRALSLGRGVRVHIGQPVVLVLRSSGSCSIQPGPVGDPYAPGDAFFDARPNPPGQWNPIALGTGRHDLPFKTYVSRGRGRI